MEYWRINCLVKFDLNVAYQSYILREIATYLWYREYKTNSFDTDKKIISPNGSVYQLYSTLDEDRFSIYIRNESNWESSHGLSEPQIVRLVEDYFKLNHNQWYFIETLTQAEDLKISQNGRAIEPLDVKSKLDFLGEDHVPKQPEIVDMGVYQYGATDIYKGRKTEFSDLLDFWNSCLYWVSCGEFTPPEKGSRNCSESYEIFLGCCIPVDEDSIAGILNEIAAKDDSFKNLPSNILLMGKDWNDEMYLMEYEDFYVLHNFHTAE